MRCEKIETLNIAVETMIDSFRKVTADEVSVQMSVITFETNVHLHIPLQPAGSVFKCRWLNKSGRSSENGEEMIEDRNIVSSISYRPSKFFKKAAEELRDKSDGHA